MTLNIVGTGHIGLSVSQTADILALSCTPISWIYREWFKKYVLKIMKNSTEATVFQAAAKHLLMPEVTEEWPDWLELEGRQYPFQLLHFLARVCRRTSVNPQLIKP